MSLKEKYWHTIKLSFEHPVTKQNVTIEASFDANWLAVFERLHWSVKALLNKPLEKRKGCCLGSAIYTG